MGTGHYYRLSFEVVDIHKLHLYSNPAQTVPNSQIPDEHWHKVSRETSDPWSQHTQLKMWADADIGFVRNIVLEKAASPPTWERVEG